MITAPSYIKENINNFLNIKFYFKIRDFELKKNYWNNKNSDSRTVKFN